MKLPTGDFGLELADTVLYPEGGGQPADHGTIDGVSIRHVEKHSDGRVLHHAERSLPLGPVQVEVDWGRRFDHMQQHSGQHLLTAIVQEDLGLATTSFHLGAIQSHIELDGPPNGSECLLELEARVNKEIQLARPIRQRSVHPEEMEALGVRTRGLPAGHQGTVRLIEIEGIDRNACGGTHVQNTAELGVIQLLAWERYKSRSRLHFIVGGRVRKHLRDSRAREQELNLLLQGGAHDHIGLVQKLLEREKQASRALKQLREERAQDQAKALAKAAGPLVHHHQPDGDMNHLRSLAKAALAPKDGRVLLLTAADENDQGVFLLAGEPGGVAKLGPVAAESMEGRGGGAGGRFQGKGSRVRVSPELLAQFQAILRQP